MEEVFFLGRGDNVGHFYKKKGIFKIPFNLLRAFKHNVVTIV